MNTLLLSMLLFVADDSVVMNHGLALDRIARGGRAPVLQDPIAERFAAGTWSTPSVGDEVTLAERTVAWRSIEAGEKGTFQDGRRLAGATLVTAVDLEEGGTWILRARGHSWVRVNGEIRGGDPYSNGLLEVPVRLRAGANEFVFRVSRGKLSARLERPSASAWVVRADPTWPDLLVGTGERAVGGVVIGNATGDWRDGLSVSVAIAGGPEVESAVPTLPPHGVRKVVAELALPVVDEEGKLPLVVSLRDETGVLVHVEEFQVQARAPEKAHRRTFISEIDGSAQEYAVTPAVGAPESPALILSLHGAGVNARGQARSYGPKDWAVVVAPTNRRPFGFDWEDWGRLDALEVLDLAERTYGTDPQRTYLTGHSMGGHGTWNLGAHAADRFAAIAPSAGWRDFWSYGGAPDWEDPDPVQEILQRAANGSRTLLLEKNYSLLGVYVLHGDADDNVPVSQARFMRERLAAFHPNFAYYEKAGAGHWWGNKCVDWPPLMEFLRANERPTPAQATSFSFTTVNPGIASRGRWVEIVTQARSMHPSTVQAQLDRKGREIALATENVTRLSIDPVGLFDGDEPFSISIDGVKTDFAGSNEGRVHLAAVGAPAIWAVAAAPAGSKGPHRAGPFKDAFRRRMVFVVGTGGSSEANAWALAKAKYDAETYQYRGNGSVRIVLDRAFDARAEPDRNVILYGNADTNAAWSSVLDPCQIDVREGSVRVGESTFDGGEYALVMIRPRSRSDLASVGVVAGSGLRGLRTTTPLPFFVSGAAWPDWALYDEAALLEGSQGVCGAGFFASDWTLGDDFALRQPAPNEGGHGR